MCGRLVITKFTCNKNDKLQRNFSDTFFSVKFCGTNNAQLINFLLQKFKQTFQVRPFQLNYREMVSFHIIEFLNNLKSLFFELLYKRYLVFLRAN